MSATTLRGGVRTFLNHIEKQPFLIADMATAGDLHAGTGIDRTQFLVHSPATIPKWSRCRPGAYPRR